ncbi:MAG: 4-amino-4-deoxychorismate lyase [Pseudohongiellaceae bacterium]|jgi:4-amino-4-deoxychorismate lyase
MTTISLINGKSGDLLSIEDRGLAYGDGLFETIAVQGGRPQLLQSHLRRLQSSCTRLSISLNVNLLLLEIEQLLAQTLADQGYILKIIVTRESSGRGYAIDRSLGSNRLLQLFESTKDYSVIREQGVRVRYCDTLLAVNPLIAGMKHLSRLENVLARSEWADENIFEGLMMDTDGFVTEGVMSNLFLVKDGLLITPHLDRCGVMGVMREFILNHLAPSLQLPTTIDRLLPEQVNNADEIFMSNSLIGIVPVVSVGAFSKSVGPMTCSLQQALAKELYV